MLCTSKSNTFIIEEEQAFYLTVGFKLKESIVIEMKYIKSKPQVGGNKYSRSLHTFRVYNRNPSYVHPLAHTLLKQTLSRRKPGSVIAPSMATVTLQHLCSGELAI